MGTTIISTDFHSFANTAGGVPDAQARRGARAREHPVGKDACLVCVTRSSSTTALRIASRELDRDGSYSAELTDALGSELRAASRQSQPELLRHPRGVPLLLLPGPEGAGAAARPSPGIAPQHALDKMIVASTIVEDAAAKVCSELDRLQRGNAGSRRSDGSAELVKQITADPRSATGHPEGAFEHDSERAARDADVPRLSHEVDELDAPSNR